MVGYFGLAAAAAVSSTLTDLAWFASPAVPAQVVGDARRLRQILGNLVAHG